MKMKNSLQGFSSRSVVQEILREYKYTSGWNQRTMVSNLNTHEEFMSMAPSVHCSIIHNS